jgi:NAD(P)-dependent dehydrogenase (short-subunit alcohol dehydrogenase family)
VSTDPAGRLGRGRGGAELPEDHLDGALDGAAPCHDGGKEDAGQDGAEEHVEDIVRVDAPGRRGAQDVPELGPRRHAQVHLRRTGAYGATKAFGLILAESLWAEWRTRGVDVLGLVLGATGTPSLRRVLDAKGGSYGGLADPAMSRKRRSITWPTGLPGSAAAATRPAAHRWAR